MIDVAPPPHSDAMTPNNSLVAAATEGGVEALESAWLATMDEPCEVRSYLDALAVLPDPQQRSAAPALLPPLLEAYQTRDAHADVIEVIKAMHDVHAGSRGMDLQQIGLDAISALYGKEDWYDLFLGLAKIDDLDPAEGIERFQKLLSLLPGSPVYHRTGWGDGVVTAIELAEDSFRVRFRSETFERSMPFTTGLEVLTVLPPEDLRARLLVDEEGLKQDAQDDPAALLKAVARLHKGRAGSKEIKQWLCGSVIPASKWASWWRKAKVAAAQDPYLAVDKPSRPVFVLRKRALSPDDETREAMADAKGLVGLLGVVRGPLSLEPREELMASMLDKLAEGVADDGAESTARAEAAVALARHGRWTQEEAGRCLHSIIENDPLGFGGLVARMNPAPLRREALEAFMIAEPQLWSDGLIANLAVLPPHILEIVAERLVAGGRAGALANRFHIFLLSPSKQPATVLRLSKRYAAGLFEGVEEAPSISEVFMGILHLAETQAFPAIRGKKDAKDTMEGVSDLLLGKRATLLQTFAKAALRSDMERAMSVLARCRAMPDSIVTAISNACKESFPDLVPRDDTPFWDSNNIFCSREGIARRQEEYRVLLEEKIPENSAAIGKAASYGDLSENFEWTAAIEQQRQLTERAAAMEAELKLARAIEDQDLPPKIVAPGMRVSYMESGNVKEIAILGPWDPGEDVVSYRAPVAAGMLGVEEGARATLELPSGQVEVTIQSVVQAL